MPWPGSLRHTERRNSNSTSRSEPPLRRMSRSDASSSEKRQLRTAPSDVMRMRSQVPQNGRVTLAMTPISPEPSM